jgi:hypothetical protein
MPRNNRTFSHWDPFAGGWAAPAPFERTWQANVSISGTPDCGSSRVRAGVWVDHRALRLAARRPGVWALKEPGLVLQPSQPGASPQARRDKARRRRLPARRLSTLVAASRTIACLRNRDVRASWGKRQAAVAKAAGARQAGLPGRASAVIRGHLPHLPGPVWRYRSISSPS